MSPLHPAPPLPVDGLAALVEVVEHRLDLDDPCPMLLRARALGDEIELGWLALAANRHPVDELLCTDAPADWCAVGVAAPGRARAAGRASAPPVDVRTVYLVGRDGAWASRWGPPGRSEAAAGPADHPGRPLGRIDDVCRRALGLPTGPPPPTTAELWALRWLDAVVEAALRGAPGATTRWGAVAALHPAVAALRADADADADPPTPAGLAADASQLARWRTWPSLRRACAAGTWDAAMAPAVAAWLDDGAFARWALAAHPDLDDLRDLVAGLLAPSVAAAVDEVLAATGAVRR